MSKEGLRKVVCENCGEGGPWQGGLDKSLCQLCLLCLFQPLPPPHNQIYSRNWYAFSMLKLTKFPPQYGGGLTFYYTKHFLNRIIPHVYRARPTHGPWTSSKKHIRIGNKFDCVEGVTTWHRTPVELSHLVSLLGGFQTKTLIRGRETHLKKNQVFLNYNPLWWWLREAPPKKDSTRPLLGGERSTTQERQYYAGSRTDFWDKKSSDFPGEIFRERNFGSSITALTTLFPLIGCGVDSYTPELEHL